MRVINVSDKPYEWQWDGKVFGPLEPGEIRDVPDEVGSHGVNRSMILDEVGEPTGQYRLKPVNAVKGTKQYEAMVKYPCTMCGPEAGVFGKDDLERHMMETHFRKPATPQAQAQQDRGGSQPPRSYPGK